MNGVVELTTDADVARFAAQADRPVVLEFWAEWCGPCRQLAPILTELAAEDRLHIGKINSDDLQEVAAQYGVQSLPTTLVLQRGEVVKSIIGGRPAARYKQELNEFAA